MKILLAGAWQYEFYEYACAEALARLGVTVERFSWSRYFSGIVGKAQLKWVLPGPAVARLNRDLLNRTVTFRPDVVFVWRGTHILPQTLQAIRRRSGALLVSYNNDDAFRPQVRGGDLSHNRRLWKYYFKTIPDYDLHFVYRKVNVAEIKAAGAKEAHILMPYLVPTLHRPVTLSQEEKGKYACEVVFVGHYEPDGRVEHLNALVEAGINVKLFGSKYWNRRVLGRTADHFGEVHALLGLEYAKALCGAQICLNFLSRLNRDTYTRRCFEIPACGRLLLSERTPDLLSFFRENEEAVYFSSPSELVDRVLWLQDRPEFIQTIAQAGHRRVFCEDHTVDGRMKWVVELLAERIHKQGAVGLV